MAFTLEDLLLDDQQLRTVQPHENAGQAINVMHQHGYGQLPVTGANKEFLGQVVTFESILQAIQSFRTEIGSLLVRDVAQRWVRSYRPDADLLTTLDDIQRDNFALIVDESDQLTGIVTTADTAVFFREYAQDLMQIEGIESRVKDAIRALYADDEGGLKSVIEAVTDRAAQIRKRVPGAIRAYLSKANISRPPSGSDTEALAEAEKKLGLPDSELRGLLERVRDVRNKLAHFRGELTSDERRMIHFAALWLETNLPAEPQQPLALAAIVTQASAHQEEDDAGPHGSYAPLAAHLEAQPADTASITLTFQEIEGILKKELPRSAYEYRAWWSNDPVKPQSAAWLDEGWRTRYVSMTERRLTFIRTNDREDAYISFFAKLNARLVKETTFTWRNVSPQGQSWLFLASLDRSRPELATIFAAFTRRKQFRIELYLDGGNKDANKQRFDHLLTRKSEIEKAIGEPLQWERMDHRRACRVAIYTKAQILTDADSLTLLEWAVKRAVRFRQAFEPEFSTP